jgi:drug/metabolite transporter (DMT)-like permease
MAGYYILVLVQTRPHINDKDDPPFPWRAFALPATFDLLGVCLMNAGLTMTHASVFQMLRGCVVIFTGVLSVAVLGRRLAPHHCAGMAMVSVGAFLVGLSSLIAAPEAAADQPTNPLLGNFLVVVAQVDTLVASVTSSSW